MIPYSYIGYIEVASWKFTINQTSAKGQSHVSLYNQ